MGAATLTRQAGTASQGACDRSSLDGDKDVGERDIGTSPSWGVVRFVGGRHRCESARRPGAHVFISGGAPGASRAFIVERDSECSHEMPPAVVFASAVPLSLLSGTVLSQQCTTSVPSAGNYRHPHLVRGEGAVSADTSRRATVAGSAAYALDDDGVSSRASSAKRARLGRARIGRALDHG